MTELELLTYQSHCLGSKDFLVREDNEEGNVDRQITHSHQWNTNKQSDGHCSTYKGREHTIQYTSHVNSDRDNNMRESSLIKKKKWHLNL